MLSIVIATKNRSDFLARLLSYYVTTGYKHWICIGDSSDSDHLAMTRETIKSFENKLKIKYYQYPNFSVSDCHKQLLSNITTPYVACVTDGGFLVTESLYKCISFLEGHSDYGIAHGLGALFELKSQGPHGEFRCLGKYDRLPKIEEETASLRLLHYLNDYSVSIYCVYRTCLWKAIWRDVDSIKDGTFAGEFLPGCLAIVGGKAKELDCLYLVRQIHSRRYLMPSLYEWITNPDWSSSYQIFHRLLTDALKQKDKISEKEANDIVKRSFWRHLNNSLTNKFKIEYGVSFRQRLKAIPGLVFCVRLVKKLFPFLKDVSLETLLNKRSPYNSDFMPIYRTVIESSKIKEKESVAC